MENVKELEIIELKSKLHKKAIIFNPKCSYEYEKGVFKEYLNENNLNFYIDCEKYFENLLYFKNLLIEGIVFNMRMENFKFLNCYIKSIEFEEYKKEHFFPSNLGEEASLYEVVKGMKANIEICFYDFEAL